MASSSPKAQRRWKNFYIFLSLRDLLMLPVSVSFIGIAVLISTVTFRNHKDFNVLKNSNYTSQVSACLNIPPPLTKIPWFPTFYQIKRIKTLFISYFFSYFSLIWKITFYLYFHNMKWTHFMKLLYAHSSLHNRTLRA